MSESNQELGVLYRAIGAVLETLAYGVYTALIPVSTYSIMNKGLRGSRAKQVLLGLTLFMYTISTLHWVSSIQRLVKVLNTVAVYGQRIVERPTCGTSGCYLVLLHSLALLNYILTDGVVVWRASVLCADESRRALRVCWVLLGLSWASVLAVIIIRITITAVVNGGETPGHNLTFGIDVTQVLTLVLSLATNALATCIIGMKAWRIRRSMPRLAQGQGQGLRADRIMTLVMESGVIYCASGLLVLISLFIPLSSGTLGTIYQPVNVHIAGIYPVTVVILVSQQRSLDKTSFASSTMAYSSSDGSHQHRHHNHNHGQVRGQLESWKVASRAPGDSFNVVTDPRETMMSINDFELRSRDEIRRSQVAGAEDELDFDYLGHRKGKLSDGSY